MDPIEGTVGSQQSILTLEKSDEPWPVQLVTAASILSIDIDVKLREMFELKSTQRPRRKSTPDPRYDYALRWLLRKLQNTGTEANGPRLNFESWVLLRELVIRTPLVNVARLLKECKFMKMLEETLKWLQENVGTIQFTADSEHSDSSATVASFSEERKTARKRKVDGTEFIPDQSSRKPIMVLETLFVALCGSVRELLLLVTDAESSQNYVAEHMKLALKSSCAQAADILGNSLYLVNHILQAPKRSRQQNHMKGITFELQEELKDTGYEPCLSPMIVLWNLRSGAPDVMLDESRNEFMSQCMLQSLHLINSFREWDHSDTGTYSLQNTIKNLLKKHVILPCRTSSGQVTSKEWRQEDFQIHFRAALTNALNTFHVHKIQLGMRADSKTKSHLIISCLSLLLKLALTCQPRNTPKLHKGEYSWLDILISQILACASDAHSLLQKDLVRLTKWMLLEVSDQKVTLSVETLEMTLERFSGLLLHDGENAHVEWGIVSLCLLIYPNIFVISSNQEKDDLYSSTNRYLNAVMFHITRDACQLPPTKDRDYEFKLSNVLIPLARAFSRARDLTSFLSCWSEQLTTIQLKKNDVKATTQNYLTIWEDDLLMQSVAELCGADLTVSQAWTFLSSKKKVIESEISSEESFFASIVILDCVIFGGSCEQMLDTLAELALSMFHTLADVLYHRPDLVRGYEWRLWRILTHINSRWYSRNASQILDDERQFTVIMVLAIKALKLINFEGVDTVKVGTSEYSETSQAFGFLCSFATFENLDLLNISLSEISRKAVENLLGFENLGLLNMSLSEVLKEAVERLLDFKGSFCKQKQDDHFGLLPGLDRVPAWAGKNLDIESTDTLYIACVTRLLMSKKVLTCLRSGQLERLFQQFYWLAMCQRESAESRPGRQYDYACNWRTLLSSEALDENGSVALALREFHTSHFHEILGSKDPKYWDTNRVRFRFSFETIQNTPVAAFDKAQKAEIANHVFRILLCTQISDIELTTEYIDLLVKLIEFPNKSMTILSNVSGVSGIDTTVDYSRPENPGSEPALMLLANKLSDVWSYGQRRCFTALRRLVDVIFNYLFATVIQGASIQYLKTFYGWLSESLDSTGTFHSTPTRSMVIEVALTSYYRHRDEVPESLKRELETLNHLRLRHLDILIEKSDDLAGEDDYRSQHTYGTAIDSMTSYPDLLCVHPNLRQISARLVGSLDERRNIGTEDADQKHYNDRFHRSFDHQQSQLLRMQYSLGALDGSLHPCFVNTAQVLVEVRSRTEKAKVLRSFQDNVSALDKEQKDHLLSAIMSGNKDVHVARSSLEVIQRVLYVIEVQQAEALRATLSKVFVFLCTRMLQSHDYPSVMISMQCLSILLQKHPKTILQWQIDNLIANITIKSSQLESCIEAKSAALAFLGLCRLFTTLLNLHRPKIGGRYHLILPALQSLLRCLFTPYPSTHESEPIVSAFGTRHASAYARILTTLADPTVSSVTRSKKRPGLDLNDETKRARSIAGQHLPYMIMEYCVCQLKGQLTLEMKRALEPGLYAVISVMTMEGMRTMNAALDVSGRAIWKVLYDDWRRFGK